MTTLQDYIDLEDDLALRIEKALASDYKQRTLKDISRLVGRDDITSADDLSAWLHEPNTEFNYQNRAVFLANFLIREIG